MLREPRVLYDTEPMHSTASFAEIAAQQGVSTEVDAIIRCQEYEWEVHRLVLSLNSSVLAQVCRDSTGEIIDLSMYDPAMVYALRIFCSRQNYRDPRELCYDEDDTKWPPMQVSQAVFHVRMAILGEEVKMPKLVTTANMHLEDRLLTETFDIFEFRDAIREVYQSPAELTELKTTLNMKLCQEPRLLGGDLFATITRELPQILVDVVIAANRRRRDLIEHASAGFFPAERRYRCPNWLCDFSFVADLRRVPQYSKPDGSKDFKLIKCPACSEGYEPNDWEAEANGLDGTTILDGSESWPPEVMPHDLIQAVRDAYSDQSSMRHDIRAIARQFVRDDTLATHPEYTELLQTYPEFAIDVVFAAAKMFRKIAREQSSDSGLDKRLNCPDSVCGFTLIANIAEMKHKQPAPGWRGYTRLNIVTCPACCKDFASDDYEAQPEVEEDQE